MVSVMEVEIRRINEKEIDLYLYLMKMVCSESNYMLMEPDEFQLGILGIKEITTKLLSRSNSAIFLAEVNKLPVGFVLAKGSDCRRNRHCAYLVIGIRKDYQNKGIGKKLLEVVDVWAQKNGVTRLELTVVNENESARALYKKSGYIEEGVRKKSLYISGQYKDEIYMSKTFN